MLKRLGAVLVVLGLAIAVPAAPAVAAVKAAVPTGLEYVALGDSYSAGFGIKPVVSGSPDGCYRAEQNYPHQLAAAIGANLTDVTCSGAVTANIDTTGQVTMNGVGPLPLQGDALSATTDLVTLTIGGNDLGFATVATQCIKLNNAAEQPIGTPGFANCKDFFNPFPGTDQLIFKLNNTVSPALQRVFTYIQNKAPNAKIFVIGYPSIAPDFAHSANGCYSSPVGASWPNPPFPQNTVPYSAVDTHYLHHIENEMDNAIQTQAASHGFTFVPTWAGSQDHTVCAADPYIFGIGFTNVQADGSPSGLPGLYVTLGALHPDPGGISFIEAQALAAIQGHPEFAEAAAPQLPATGPQPALLVGAAVALLGAGLLLAGRRRTRS